MEILAVAGSPGRAGNTDALVERVLEGAQGEITGNAALMAEAVTLGRKLCSESPA